MNITEAKILLVEDNEGDVVLTLEALKEAKVVNAVQVIEDGEAALQYLRKEGIYKDAVTPDLVLLDINLPRIDGIAVLAEIKKDENLAIIPVIMLTTSNAERDVMESYKHHANCYIAKPVEYQKFMEVVIKIKDFWISIVKLPGH